MERGFREGQDAYFATTRRVLLLLRGGKFCNHEEEKNQGISGVSRAGGIASPVDVKLSSFFKIHTLLFMSKQLLTQMLFPG